MTGIVGTGSHERSTRTGSTEIRHGMRSTGATSAGAKSAGTKSAGAKNAGARSAFRAYNCQEQDMRVPSGECEDVEMQLFWNCGIAESGTLAVSTTV